MLKSGQNITALFSVTDPDNKTQLIDADSLPTGTLVINGIDNAAAVTVTNKSTGKYKVSVTLPSLNAGDVVEIYIDAELNSIASGNVVFRDIAETKRVSDLQDLTAAQVNEQADLAISDAGLATSAEVSSVDGKVDLIKTGVDKLTAEYDFEVDYTNGKLYIYTKNTTDVIEEYNIQTDGNNRITNADIV